MKYHPVTTSKFAKDYDRAKKRGKDIQKLKGVIAALLLRNKAGAQIQRSLDK